MFYLTICKQNTTSLSLLAGRTVVMLKVRETLILRFQWNSALYVLNDLMHFSVQLEYMTEAHF